MVFGRKKRTLNQEAFYLGILKIEIPHKYKYFGIDYCSHAQFEASSKKVTYCRYERLDDHLKERSKNHMLGTQIPSIQGFGASHMVMRFGEVTWKNSHWKNFFNDMQMHMMSHV